MSDLDVQNINSKTGNSAISIADDGTNVGIGTASPSTNLHVSGTGLVQAKVESTDSVARLDLIAADGSISQINLGDASAVNAGLLRYDHSSDYMTFFTNTSERMRIDSAGNVGISTTPSGWGGAFDAIDVGPYGSFSADNDTTFITNNAYFNGTNWIYKNSNLAGRYRQQQGLHVWDTAASGTAGGTLTFLEAMRIDSAGQLLFNCTTNSQTSGEGVKFVGNGRMYTVSSYSNSLQENLTMYSTGASAFRFYVDWGGTIHATSTSISGISDERLKENIVDLETGLTEVMSLKPRRFDWKDDDKKNVAGFVAQEVETVLPDLVDQFKHNTLEDAKGVRVGDMIPTLVKAIQEQQAMIEELKAEVAALKGA